MSELSQRSFNAVCEMFRNVSGIKLAPEKRSMVVGRLQKLANESGAASLDDFIERVVRGDDPTQVVKVVDKLTTNETYFFREPQHFAFLERLLAERRGGGEFRVWSAASSSGEEAYSIAMVLADKIGRRGWQIVGTDLSTSVLASARRALYPMDRTDHMPPGYLKRFCLKGLDEYAGQLLIDKPLRANVRFEQANLMQPLPDIGLFDVVFLRNVLIYFDNEKKAEIVQRVVPQLKPGGYLFTGHSESLSMLKTGLRQVQPAIYART
ncbi:protein-glutamate O-methyltransferase CheR [Aquabacterium sp.]|uniref:CheR family methyltransferase n=1 Tax=Aquabacterium sp. TaxID=1872578 RepID=UPI0035B037D7